MPHDPDDDLRSRDERAAERLLAALEAGGLPETVGAARAGADEPDELLARLYTELLGLMPLALDERPPSPELRARVLAAASDEATVDAAGPEAEDPEGAEDREEPAVAAFPRAAAAGRTAGGREVSVDPAGEWQRVAGGGPRRPAGDPGGAPPPTAVPRWFAAAAAALTLALVGLGLFAGWLHGRLDVQERTIAGLRASLEQTERRADALAAAQDDLERLRLDLASQLALVSTPGVEVCPLRPVGETAEDDALGLLFLSNAQREWYVRVARLDPPPEGRIYVLWFQMDRDRYVSAGVLEPGPDEAIQLSGTEMPTPDEMTGAAVTLERAGAQVDRPAGPVVLFGDERIGMV